MTIERYARRVEVQQRLVELFREAVELGADEPDFVGNWVYTEWHTDRDKPDGERRRLALAWLQRQMPLLRLVAREYGAEIKKVANEHVFGVEVNIIIDGDYMDCVRALVPASLTCELVPTGEYEVIPAQEERVEPVMERRCPPSIFAGIESEAVNA